MDSFLSPIPRDPTQRLFVDDGARQAAGRRDSFLDSDADAMTGMGADASRPSDALAALSGSALRRNKRQRIESESAAIVKSEQLSTEVESLRVQLESRIESHQIQLKERDLQVTQLRRQLNHAVAEEDSARQELKTLSHDFANERLQLQKKIVELESKLQFVETSFSEWREKAQETESELRDEARRSKLKIELLNDEIESLKGLAAPPTPVKYAILESTVKMLETSLRDKDAEVKLADERIQNASSTLETSKDVRALNEQIIELTSRERKLKQELVDFIEASKKSALSDEKLLQMRRKLQASEDRCAEAQKEIAALNVRLQTAPFLEKDYENEIAQLKESLLNSERESKKLAAQLEKTEKECAVLEKRLGRGEFNPTTTKVVHMGVNPTSELLGLVPPGSELERLRQEVEELRRRLKDPASVASAVTTIPATASTPTTTTSYETVQGQKLLNQRLKEVFQNQIQQYREAVYQLTGYKVDLKKTNGVELLRLRSMYADHDDDELLVRMEPEGGLELLETDFCGQINKRVFANKPSKASSAGGFVGARKNIP